jgi:putative ABC transport system permease protein
VKASTPPESLIPAIRSIIRQTDPQQAISDVRPLAEIVGMETASRSVQVRVLGAFAAVAFLLAAVGIHGLLSFAVSQRTPEFGVRIALGAQRGDIVSMVLRQGALLAVAGVIPGIALAYAAGRAMEALLAGVKPADAITFLAATGLCIAMTLGGSLLPALRALRIDPVRAIRAE